MKIKRKCKIHPSPVTSIAAPEDYLSVLDLLPAAILALVAALSFQDREVVAYLITRSLKTTTTNSINCCSSPSSLMRGSSAGMTSHKTAAFDCECFDCYTSFWLRWDSSPSRELIHQAIESFEDHMATGELQITRSSSRNSRKKEKLPLQKIDEEILQTPNTVVEVEPSFEFIGSGVSEEIDVNPTVYEASAEEAAARTAARTAAGDHRVFAKKVLPDVLGVFNSRLWNLWGPDV